jgi:ferritin-like metal-binding protein YciE
VRLKTLDDLFLDELRDIYSAEKQLTKALPKLAKAADAPDLKAAFETHLTETEGQIERIERVFELLGHTPRAKTCEAMQGLVAEGAEMAAEDGDPAVRDAGLIAGAQKVEHYEIAGYGCLITWAKRLGHGKVARLLEQTLAEEKATDEKLTTLAESLVNAEAAK